MKISSLNFENARYERKFLISDVDIKEIEYFIKFNPIMFSEIFYERRVNNIYLDSVDFGSYADNINGNLHKAKIRIRWYGKIFGKISKPVLEIKIKNGELGKKMKFPLRPFLLNKNFSKGYLQKEVFNKSNLPRWLVENLKLYNLALLNSYKRMYFISSNKQYRITLDKDMVFFKIQDTKNSFKDFEFERRNVILELKYKRKNDLKISQITQHFPFRLTKSSKYVCGIDLLDY